MIQMPMREDDRIGGFDVRGKIFVDSPGLVAGALVKAHVQKNSQAVHFQKMRRAGDRAVGAAELDAHVAESIRRWPTC